MYSSTTLVLLLLGAMCALLLSAHSLSDHLRRNMKMSVVVSSRIDEAEVLKFQKQLEKQKYVAGTEYISGVCGCISCS